MNSRTLRCPVWCGHYHPTDLLPTEMKAGDRALKEGEYAHSHSRKSRSITLLSQRYFDLLVSSTGRRQPASEPAC